VFEPKNPRQNSSFRATLSMAFKPRPHARKADGFFGTRSMRPDKGGCQPRDAAQAKRPVLLRLCPRKDQGRSRRTVKVTHVQHRHATARKPQARRHRKVKMSDGIQGQGDASAFAQQDVRCGAAAGDDMNVDAR